MLKISDERLSKLDSDYPGVRDFIVNLEAKTLPICPHCDCEDTAEVNVGVIGRTIAMAGATSRFKLIPNGPKPGEYFCNGCQSFFETDA